MTERKKCPKCGEAMAEGSAETLFDAFGCTRPDPKDLKKRHGNRIQPFYCKGCGYIEIYKETKDQRKLEQESKRRELKREKAHIRRKGQPTSIPSRERSYV